MPIEQDKEFDTNIRKVDNNTIKFIRTQEWTITRAELVSQRDHYEKELGIIQDLLNGVSAKLTLLETG